MSHGYGTFLTARDKFPKGEHWAILSLKSVTIPGDERSRQAPGHGYPEHTETMTGYEWFTNFDEFNAALLEKLQSPFYEHDVIGIHVTETYGKRVVVSVEPTGVPNPLPG